MLGFSWSLNFSLGPVYFKRSFFWSRSSTPYLHYILLSASFRKNFFRMVASPSVDPQRQASADLIASHHLVTSRCLLFSGSHLALFLLTHQTVTSLTLTHLLVSQLFVVLSLVDLLRVDLLRVDLLLVDLLLVDRLLIDYLPLDRLRLHILLSHAACLLVACILVARRFVWIFLNYGLIFVGR